ncbi:hypothetical protein, partial [Sphingopyxis sp.]|uniref:hypothetical protein n=1 Tax=Sphingopyxis sp. TaxID=1908224 RepID=UPI004036E147
WCYDQRTALHRQNGTRSMAGCGVTIDVNFILGVFLTNICRLTAKSILTPVRIPNHHLTPGDRQRSTGF